MGHKYDKFTQTDFINKANIIHNFTYDYSLVKYVDYTTNVIIVCKIHGEFTQLPSNHCVKKCGCTKCRDDKYSKLRRLSNNEVVLKIHNNFGTNSLVLNLNEYINTNSKLTILCLKHNIIFNQYAKHLFNGTAFGCKKCSINKNRNEIEIQNFFIKNNIKFLPQHKFDNLKFKNHLFFDFYLPDYNLCVEYDGKQHYESFDFFGGDDMFKIIQERDKLKNEYCINNNIGLLRIKYNEKILIVLNNFFNK